MKPPPSQPIFATAPLLLVFFLSVQAQEITIDKDRSDNTVILDKKGVENLGIETWLVSDESFEESFFAIGRIEVIPRNHAVLSSRVAGRIVALNAFEGDQVKVDSDLVRVESRLPGDPPPKIWLKAPISGLITESHVKLGEPVEPEKEMLDILDLSEVWAVAHVPEDLAPKLEPGETRAYIRIAALGNEPLEGTLLRFGTFAHAESGTVDALFQIPNKELRMRPGMRAEFNVVTEVRKDVMAVPRTAIQGDPANRIVYVKDFDLPNAFVRVPVKLGSQNDRFVEVTGLFPGDEVVTTGSYLLGFAGAGGGGLSLKEALDAAHGHEHNEDGTIMSDKQKAERDAKRRAAAGLDGTEKGPLTVFLMIACGVLLVLLLLSIFIRHPGRKSRTEAA